MTREPLPPSLAGRSAAYLRCYPADAWGMPSHRIALQEYAFRLHVPEPVIHFDNGSRSGTALPELTRLIHCVRAGLYRLVLIPGPWVFHLHSGPAQRMVQHLVDLGCMVLELPTRWRPQHEERRSAVLNLLSPNSTEHARWDA